MLHRWSETVPNIKKKHISTSILVPDHSKIKNSSFLKMDVNQSFEYLGKISLLYMNVFYDILYMSVD
jgi:hypothetical protein